MLDSKLIKPKYIYIALLLYIITAYFSAGHNAPDEYYQILEFAAYKLGFGNPQFLMWEYHAQMRPALQTLIVCGVYKSLASLSIINPFITAFVTRLLSGLLSLLAMYVFIQAFISSIKIESLKKWFILLSFFTWLIVYNGIRFSSENFSSKLFLLGFSLIFLPNIRQSIIIYIGIGLLLGFSFIARFQTGALILGLILWLVIINNFFVINGINKKVITFNKLCMLLIGMLLAIIIGVFIDKWFYGDWVFTAWNYLNMNIFQGKADTFGEESWAYYLLVAALLPYGPLYIFSSIYCLIYKFRNPVVWVSTLFVLMHVIIGHKELRFLVPSLCFMPLLIFYCFENLITRFKISFNNTRLKKLWRLSWRLNCFLVVVVALTPSAIQLPLCKFIYDKYSTPLQFNYITEGGNELDFYKRANVDLVQIKNVDELKCDVTKTCLVALTCQQVRENQKFATNNKIIYNNCPSWLFKINFTGWLDRTAIYNIYEVTNK